MENRPEHIKNASVENIPQEDEPEQFPQNILDNLCDFQDSSVSLPNSEEKKEISQDSPSLIDIHW